MNSLRLLRPEEVLYRWDELAPLLQRAVDQGRGELEVEDIRALVLAGRMFLLATDAYVVTCEFAIYPQKTVMVVGFGSGDIHDHEEVQKVLEEFARSGGASSIQMYCRKPSMRRYFERFFEGVAPAYTVLEKTL